MPNPLSKVSTIQKNELQTQPEKPSLQSHHDAIILVILDL